MYHTLDFSLLFNSIDETYETEDDASFIKKLAAISGMSERDIRHLEACRMILFVLSYYENDSKLLYPFLGTIEFKKSIEDFVHNTRSINVRLSKTFHKLLDDIDNRRETKVIEFLKNSSERMVMDILKTSFNVENE